MYCIDLFLHFVSQNLWCTGLLHSLPRFGCYSIRFTSIVFWICFHLLSWDFRFFLYLFWVPWHLYRCVIYVRFDLSDDLVLYQNNHSNNSSTKQTASTLPFVYTFISFITSSSLFFTFSLLQQILFFSTLSLLATIVFVVILIWKRFTQSVCTVHTVHRATCIQILSIWWIFVTSYLSKLKSDDSALSHKEFSIRNNNNGISSALRDKEIVHSLYMFHLDFALTFCSYSYRNLVRWFVYFFPSSIFQFQWKKFISFFLS